MFSFYYRSRLDFHLANGKRYDNENLRYHTRGLRSKDGYKGQYSYLSIDTSPDTAETKWGACPARAVSHRTTHHRKRRRPGARRRRFPPAVTG